jgi:hypothetical protein
MKKKRTTPKGSIDPKKVELVLVPGHGKEPTTISIHVKVDSAEELMRVVESFVPLMKKDELEGASEVQWSSLRRRDRSVSH